MMACYNGQTLAVKKLLEIPDIDVNFQGRDGRTALIDSVRGSDYRYESVLRMLLSQPDINLDLQDMYHRTALMISIEKGNLRMAYMLIIAGADVAGTVPFVERNLKSAKTEEEREQYQTLLNLVK